MCHGRSVSHGAAMTGSYASDLRALVGPRCVFLPGVRTILLDEHGAVLLQRRTDMDCWGFPGGSLELEHSALDDPRREVREETGLEVIEAEPMALCSGPGERFRYPNGDEVQPFAMVFIVRVWWGFLHADACEDWEVWFWPLDALPEAIVPIHARNLSDFQNYKGRFMVFPDREKPSLSSAPSRTTPPPDQSLPHPRCAE